MTIHLSRDYLTQYTTGGGTYIRNGIPGYLAVIFLRRVLGYTYVGDTNFNINTVGTLLIATGDSTPGAATPTFAPGTKAGINFGAGFVYEVSIPVAVRTIISGDIGKILVLKSTANPTFNSGTFLITGINAGANRYIISYRSPDNPPAEADDSIQWYLYAADVNSPSIAYDSTHPLPNAGPGYRGNGTSNASRLILQSPHATGWQVRICYETLIEQFTVGTTAAITIAPGFGGNSAGDFAVGGDHLHTALYYNTADGTNYFGETVGCGDNSSSAAQYRITMIGDDTGQSVALFQRRVADATGPNSCLVSFGIPDNEPTPLPTNNVSRLYVLGSTSASNNGNYLNDISYRAGNYQLAPLTGISSSLFKIPISCAVSLWAYVTGNNQTGSPINNAQAGDCPFLSSTELLPIELMAGTTGTWGLGTLIFPFEPRLLGTIPFLKIGRSNFGNWSLTTDVGKAWQHTRRGIYMMWNGPSTTP